MFLPLYPRRLLRPTLQPGLRPARPGTYDASGQAVRVHCLESNR